MARTVALGTITQALIDTQKVSGRTPYISININSTEYWSRLLYIEHHEEAYRERAIIGLSNRDNSLDGLDLDGKEFEIKYGYDSSAQGGSTTDTVDTATLWVKSHQIISIQGERIYQIYAEGMWMRLREQKVIAGVTGNQDGSDLGGQPYGNIFDKTKTVYDLIELIIEGALGWTLENNPPNDLIIDVFKPTFVINKSPYESAAALLYRLIWMTKEYLRPKASKTFQCVYPQVDDDEDEIYYSYQAHWFTEYAEKSILLIPNSIVVLCNQDPVTGDWNTIDFPLIVGTNEDQTQINKYFKIIEVFQAASITSQLDADRRAQAILTKLKSEILGGRLLVPHDAQVELYDKVSIVDTRT